MYRFGAVTLERVYPMMLGANMGTTSTAMLAAFSASGDSLEPTVQIALCHMFFNLTGILIWYPIPLFRKVPLGLANFLGKTTSRYRWFAFVYLVVMFFVLPLTVFLLSIPGWWLLACVLIPVIILACIICTINVLQRKRPSWLPSRMRTWHFLPLCCRSLQPMDSAMMTLITKCNCCGCCDSVLNTALDSSDCGSDIALQQTSTTPATDDFAIIVNNDSGDTSSKEATAPHQTHVTNGHYELNHNNNHANTDDDVSRSTSSLVSDSKRNTNNNCAAARGAMTSSMQSLSSSVGQSRRNLFEMKPYGSQASLSSVVSFETHV